MRHPEYASFGIELAAAKAKGRTLAGYASVFNYPIQGGSTYETFMRPGAFKKTLRERGDQVQVLFNHGQDPSMGMLPLGRPSVMREDSRGLYVEVPLVEADYADRIVAALKGGALRAMSIMFEATDEDFNEDRTERNIRQVKLFEFGPVTFPRNQAAVATLHSLSDFEHTLEDVDQPQAESPSVTVAPEGGTVSYGQLTWAVKRGRELDAYAAQMAELEARITKL